MARFSSALVLTAAFVVAGCQQAPPPEPEPAPPPPPEPVQTAPAPAPEPVVEPPAPPPLTDTRLIFFDFDKSDIRPEFREIVAAHAALLADTGGKVRLEGHADERGSREYNIGLGERRAQSVRQALMLQGVQGSQISTLSYGEERPLDPGTGEYAWSQNRRVEIVYLP